MSSIRFSVVTPSFNQGQYIRQCIESVLHQDVADFEHIVVDNCSNDTTRDVISEYPHVRFISESDNGQSDALNKGFKIAKGEVICWLNADDQYVENAFNTVGKEFELEDRDVVYGNTEVVKEGDDPGAGRLIYRPHLVSRMNLLYYWRRGVGKLHQPAVFFRRTVFDKVGYLKEDLHFVMDHEFWWRLSGEFDFHYVDRVLARQRLHLGCKTWRQRDKCLEERRRVFFPLLTEHVGGIRLHHRMAVRRIEGIQCFRASERLKEIEPPESRRLFIKAFMRYPKLAVDRNFLSSLYHRLSPIKNRRFK